MPCTTKLRVNRPRSRAWRRARVSSAPDASASVARDCGVGPALGRRRGRAPEPRARPARRPRRCGRPRRPAPSRADRCGAGAARAARLPRRRAVHRPEHGDLRLCPRRDRAAVDDAGVQVARRAPRRRVRGRAAIAASTRGSSCATSATTSSQPGSARTASRSWRGSCSAPPPDDAQRPVTTPPGTYTGRNRPSRTHSSSQVQPFADCRRDSFLYSSSGSMTGCRCSASSHRLVDSTSTPARCRARSSFGCESRLALGSPSAVAHALGGSRRASPACRPPAGRSPSTSARMRSCAAASHGRPAARSSSAMRAPADSAAVEQSQSAGVGAMPRSPRAAARTPPAPRRGRRVGRRGGAASSTQSKSAGACGLLGDRGCGIPLRRRAQRRRSSATSADPRRIAWHRRRSWQRATRTPAASSAAYQAGASLHTHRGATAGLGLGHPGRERPTRGVAPASARRRRHRASRPRPRRRSGRGRSRSRGQPCPPSRSRRKLSPRSIDSFAAASARLFSSRGHPLERDVAPGDQRLRAAARAPACRDA